MNIAGAALQGIKQRGVNQLNDGMGFTGDGCWGDLQPPGLFILFTLLLLQLIERALLFCQFIKAGIKLRERGERGERIHVISPLAQRQ